MSRLAGRPLLTIALVIAAALVALLVVRFVVGLVLGLAKLALVAAVVAGAAYVGFRLWRGWTAAGAEVEPRQR